MIKIIAIVVLLSVSTLAFPANNNNEQLDKNIKGSFFIADKEMFRKYKNVGYYLDQATINDVAVNSVTEEKRIEQNIQPVLAPASTIEISGISTGASSPNSSPPLENTPFKPPKASSMFARFIDDIFQGFDRIHWHRNINIPAILNEMIPIAVLQNVAKLITNPFQRKTPEVVATVS